MSVKIMTAKEAVKLIESGKVLCNEGFVGDAIAEELLLELQNRYLESGEPKNLTLVYSAGQGDGNEATRGLNHLGEEGLLSRVIAGHWNQAPRLQKLAMENKLEAYNLPQGTMAQMYRDIAAGRPTISRVGLQTFVDPRLDGGKINEVTKKDIVHLIEIGGEEYLQYDQEKFDYAFIRGTYADENGNISMEEECCNLGVLAIAEATKCNGGIVIAQVEKVVKADTLDPRLVRVPGILVDVVVPVSDMKHHMQTNGTQYNPSFNGEVKAVLAAEVPPEMSVRKMITRRCAMELKKDAVVNLGIGMPELVAAVANEEGIGSTMTLTVEAGVIGGVPMSGQDFGSSVNPDCIVDQAAMFDFYDGGGLDIAYLGLAECDKDGNINVSKFGPRIAGCGGFINITQNARKVVFCGTFTAKGLKVHGEDGKLVIDNEGSISKFVDTVQHVTFSGDRAKKLGQKVMYITERCVLEMTENGLELTEIAPGIDLEKDVLAHIAFDCKVSDNLKLMDARIFNEEKMGLTL
ncbi:MAG: acyl CoA:acetate/3-ketoacid CoA transferase [Lachnospiraceae bacterium]|nr:acyl CoA:acetate/3-ketoacid CoA transferase [Candidatus Equihabitans merdae]